MAVAVMPYLSAYNFIDMSYAVFLGFIRGLAMQKYVYIWIIFCFYTISVPLACVLAIDADHGIEGLWTGYFVGVGVQVVIIMWVTSW